jgi:hypothetical protein
MKVSTICEAIRNQLPDSMEVVQGRQARCLQVTHWDGHSQGRRGAEQAVAVYCRVCSSENKGNQKRRLLDYCAAKGYNSEQGSNRSGINDTRNRK